MATAQHTVQGPGDAGDTAKRELANNDYTVGWICALSTAYVAARAFLDDEHEGPEHSAQHDNNDYTLGRIGKHNVVIAVLPDSEYGTASAATVARDILHSFPNVRISLMVGIGGGAPSQKNDIRLGDIVVSAPRDGHGGVFQYDFGKTIQDQTFYKTGFLTQPPTILHTAVDGIRAQYESDGHQIQEAIEAILQTKPRLQKKYRQPGINTDRLYQADFIHPLNDEADCATSCNNNASALIPRPARDEDNDNPAVHYGLIASANQLMKDAVLRDKLACENDVLCFEMEAAGQMKHFPCLVIRGICDYADTHKNKAWQGYAAMTAAAYAKDLLGWITPDKVEAEKRLSELLTDVNQSLRVVQTTAKHTQQTVVGLETDGRLNKIRTLLSPPDQSSNFNKAREQNHEGTGQWFLESDQYQNIERLLCRKDTDISSRNSEVEDDYNDTDKTDVESILSTTSETSSQSSAPSRGEIPLAASELANLLFEVEEINELLTEAYSKVGEQRFTRNIGKLLKAWGRSLRTKVSGELQHQVAQFVQRSAERIAIQLGSQLAIGSGSDLLRLRHPQPNDSHRLNDWIESLGFFKTQDTNTGNNTYHASTENSDEEIQGDSDDANITLGAAKAFLRNSEVLSELCHNLRQWLDGGLQKRPNKPLEDETSMVPGSTGNFNVSKPQEEGLPNDDRGYFSVGREVKTPTASRDLPWSQEPGSQSLKQPNKDHDHAETNFAEDIYSLWDLVTDHGETETTLNGENNSSQFVGPSPPVAEEIASPPSQEIETDHEDAESSTSKTPLLRDLESQTNRPHATSASGWANRCLARLYGAHRSLYQSISDSITALIYPNIPPGYTRISWRSARGKLMYMDLETTDTEEAREMEHRFRGPDSPAPECLPSRTHLESTFNAPQDLAATLPSGAGIPVSTRLPDNRHVASQNSAQGSTPTEAASSRAGADLRKKFLLLCYSSRGSDHLSQMEVSNLKDRALFEAIRRDLLKLEDTRHPAWYFKVPRRFRLLKTKDAGFVQFIVMPSRDGNRPQMIESGRPPAAEVDHNWLYRPCPSEIKNFNLGVSFIQHILDPGHADVNKDAWFRLLPKKVNTNFDVHQGGDCVAYGIQIKEGQNHFAIVLAWLLAFLVSGVVGIICAITIDPGTGFTIAAWLAVLTGLALACLQLLPP